MPINFDNNSDKDRSAPREPVRTRTRTPALVRRVRTEVLEGTRTLMESANVAARRLGVSGPGILVIPPAAPGSMGDEAMVVATVAALRARAGGPIGIVRYRAGADYPVAVEETVDLSRYFLQGGARGEELLFLKALLTYRSVVLLGADVLDGYYSDDAVRLRLRLVELAARAGAQTFVLGFSFNSAPTSRATDLVSGLPAAVRLLARDPLSCERLSAIAGERVERVADTAFLLEASRSSPRMAALSAWASGVHARGGRVLGVNLSAVAMEAAGLDVNAALEYARDTLVRLRASRPGTSFFLLPHDTRGRDSDVALLRRLARDLVAGGADVCLLQPPLTAPLVKEACAIVDLVWTGRMHLAIAALGQGVPVVAHEYQGKFAGLFADFGIEGLLLNPECLPDAAALAAALGKTLDNADAVRAIIADRLPQVAALSRRNIDLVVA